MDYESAGKSWTGALCTAVVLWGRGDLANQIHDASFVEMLFM